MIKGILALFRSGAIFNPMVFFGILLGFIAEAFLNDDQLRALYTHHAFYLLLLLIAIAYVISFRRVYYRGGIDTDWGQTTASIIGHFLKLTLSFICTLLFVSFMSFDTPETSEYNLPEYEKLEQEVRLNQQQLEENYQAIMQVYEIPQQAENPSEDNAKEEQ